MSETQTAKSDAMVSRLAAVRVFVANVDKATRFYRDSLGLDCVGQSKSAAVFRVNDIDFIVEYANPAHPEGAEMIGRFTALSFAVGDCAGVVGKLTGIGVQFLGPAQKQDWGGTLAHFLDPDGNVLTLVQYPQPT
jgi:catechol 2,3-dioxygenase-like lactoylglutathione lyase family enzyme